MNHANASDDVRMRATLAGDKPIAEFLVPILDEPWQDRGTNAAADLARHLSVPLRFVHMGGGDEAPLSVAPPRVTTAKPDIEIRSTTIEGDDVAAVIRAVATPGSVIVLATDNAREWTTKRSVGETLVRTAADPVVLCGPNVVRQPAEGSVVVALDGSPAAEAGIELGAAMARNQGVSLWLVQAVDSATTAQVRSLADTGERVSESAYLRSVADAADVYGVQVGWEILHNDDPVLGVVNFTWKRGAGLIVATSHGASGLSHQLFGSTCLGFVERSSVPVMITRSVRPDVELMGPKAQDASVPKAQDASVPKAQDASVPKAQDASAEAP